MLKVEALTSIVGSLKEEPLVSVICLCYNQSKFVEETLVSVFNQTYSNVEIIVVDDASTDGSQKVIERILSGKSIPFLSLNKNLGNTTAFNWGLAQAHGKYVVDLACDDILMPNRIEKQVNFFEECNDNIGVIYSDAQYIDEASHSIGRHFASSKWTPYEGEVYAKLVAEYFVPPPTMMMKREVLLQLNGYDETLAYEDFDFWVRSSRNWHYAYQDEVLTQIRKVVGSHSTTLYQPNDKKLASTIKICRKIAEMNNSEAEDEALVKRLRYEIKHAFLTGHTQETSALLSLLAEKDGLNWVYSLIAKINRIGLNLSWLRRVILNVRT